MENKSQPVVSSVEINDENFVIDGKVYDRKKFTVSEWKKSYPFPENETKVNDNWCYFKFQTPQGEESIRFREYKHEDGTGYIRLHYANFLPANVVLSLEVPLTEGQKDLVFNNLFEKVDTGSLNLRFNPKVTVHICGSSSFSDGHLKDTTKLVFLLEPNFTPANKNNE